MKICPSCGYENIDDAQFCRDCGFNLNQAVEKPQNSIQSTTLDGSDEPIIKRMFFKVDKHTNEVRFAKTKSISIAVFVLCFIWGLTYGSSSIYGNIVVSIMFALVFAIPVYVIGFVVGLIIDRIQY